MKLLSTGWHAVDLFFILSGYVLMRTHGQEFFRPSGKATLAFFKIRLARVYPLNFVVALLIGCPVLLDAGFVTWCQSHGWFVVFTPNAFLETIFLATRWGLPRDGSWNEPVWSLSAEIIGYALFPLIAWLLMRSPARKASILTAALSLALLAYIQLSIGGGGKDNDIQQFGSLSRMLSGFTAGMACARAMTLLPGSVFRINPVFFAAIVLLLAGTYQFQVYEWTSNMFFCAIILCLSCDNRFLKWIFSSKPIMFLGRVSFPLYLVHAVPLFWLNYQLEDRIPSPILAIGLIVLYITFCFFSAWVLHVAVERPTHRWGRRWAAETASPIAA